MTKKITKNHNFTGSNREKSYRNLIEHQILFRILGAPILFSPTIYVVHDLYIINGAFTIPTHPINIFFNRFLRQKLGTSHSVKLFPIAIFKL